VADVYNRASDSSQNSTCPDEMDLMVERENGLMHVIRAEH
jgi:hypothetical protein